MEVVIKADYTELSETAAAIVAAAIAGNPRLRLCLAAGRTPEGLYRALVRRYQAGSLDMSQVSVFNLDEFEGLAPDHPLRFGAFLHRSLLDRVNVDPRHIYPPSADYEDTIERCGGIDLLIAGIGPNGHLAFNEPGSGLDSRTRRVALADSTIEAMRSKFAPQAPPRFALTMGLKSILQARRVLLLASGAAKAEILHRAIRETPNLEVPASALQLHPNVTLVADLAAASAL